MNACARITRATLLAMATLPATWSGTSAAGHDELGSGPGLGYGRVLQAQPVFETVQVGVPEERCWKERLFTQRQGPFDGDRSAVAGMLLGGVAGGIFGNRLGSGDGRAVMTVAGVILGAAIGHEMADRIGRDGRDGHRCETVERIEAREELVGYDVQYLYRGRTLRTQTDQHPGRRIRVDHGLKPMFF